MPVESISLTMIPYYSFHDSSAVATRLADSRLWLVEPTGVSVSNVRVTRRGEKAGSVV